MSHGVRLSIDNLENKTVLNIFDEDIHYHDANYIAQALRDSKVTDLSLRRSRISYDGLKCLSDIFKHNKITRLDLCHCLIKDKGIIYLFSVLKNMEITDLNIADNEISCNDLKYLADVLPDTKITHLSLDMNNIKDEGLNYLTSVLKDTKIIELDLASNSFGYDAALSLNKTLKNTKIEELSLDIFCKESDAHRSTCVQQFSRLHDKTKMFHKITIENCNIEIDGFHYFNEIFQTMEIYEFCLNTGLKETTAEYLAQTLKDVVIHNLDAWKRNVWATGEYLTQAFKGSYITLLHMGPKRGFFLGSKNAIKFLEEVNILILFICDCELENYGMSLLAPAIKKSNIMEITLDWCDFECDGVLYLSQVLRDSKIVYLNLTGNYIGNDGIKYLADGLPGSQVTYIKLENKIGNLCTKPLEDIIENTNLDCVDIQCTPTSDSFTIKRSTISVANKLCNSFKTIVSLNQAHGEFEFVLPKDSTSLEQYIFLIKTLLENNNSKVHIFYMMCRNEDPWTSYKCLYDRKMMKKIDDFVSTIISKFNTFFNDRLSDLIESICTDCIQCVNIVKQFEEAQLGDIVQNLLLHRVLYFVDENQEILHPFIYKLLNKYNMPLYNERVEPDKMEKIISFYQNHQEIDGAKEIIDFLRTNPCDIL